MVEDRCRLLAPLRSGCWLGTEIRARRDKKTETNSAFVDPDETFTQFKTHRYKVTALMSNVYIAPFNAPKIYHSPESGEQT